MKNNMDELATILSHKESKYFCSMQQEIVWVAKGAGAPNSETCMYVDPSGPESHLQYWFSFPFLDVFQLG